MLKCKCGNETKFLGRQEVSGYVDVYVDASGGLIGNTTEDGNINTDSMNFEDPEGPFVCPVCGEEVAE